MVNMSEFNYVLFCDFDGTLYPSQEEERRRFFFLLANKKVKLIINTGRVYKNNEEIFNFLSGYHSVRIYNGLGTNYVDTNESGCCNDLILKKKQDVRVMSQKLHEVVTILINNFGFIKMNQHCCLLKSCLRLPKNYDLRNIEGLLEEANMRPVYIEDKLDIVPIGYGKHVPIDRELENMPSHVKAIVAGDSGNDFDMFTEKRIEHRWVVGDELRVLLKKEFQFQTLSDGIKGLIEALTQLEGDR